MEVKTGTYVSLPRCVPYPQYGRVMRLLEGDCVLVTEVECGDPRCPSEHQHSDAVWPIALPEAAHAYQGRASWENGRFNSPNAVLVDSSAQVAKG